MCEICREIHKLPGNLQIIYSIALLQREHRQTLLTCLNRRPIPRLGREVGGYAPCAAAVRVPLLRQRVRLLLCDLQRAPGLLFLSDTAASPDTGRTR